MVRSGVQVSPEDAHARGGRRCPAIRESTGRGVRGGVACARRGAEGTGRRGRPSGRWRGRGGRRGRSLGRAKCGAYRGCRDGGPGGEAGPWSGVLVGRDAARVKREPPFQSRPSPAARGATVRPRQCGVRWTRRPRVTLGTRQHRGGRTRRAATPEPAPVAPRFWEAFAVLRIVAGRRWARELSFKRRINFGNDCSSF